MSEEKKYGDFFVICNELSKTQDIDSEEYLNTAVCEVSEELDVFIANFILSVRKKGGEEFEPISLRSMISNIDRALRRHRYEVSIMQSPDNIFTATKQALKAKQKDLKQKGKGNRPQKADPLSDDDINIFYDSGVLGVTSPQSLLNTVWFNNAIHLGLCGHQEHYNLCWGDISLHKNPDGTEYLQHYERQTKTRTGANTRDTRTVLGKLFSIPHLNENNPIEVYKKYASLRPQGFCEPNDPFYIATRTNPLSDKKSDLWFIKQRLGVNKIGKIMGKMIEKCPQIADSGKRLTNTSTRKYCVQKLRENNITPTDLMQVTGHKNVNSINNYSEITVTKQKEMSKILSTTKNRFNHKSTRTSVSCRKHSTGPVAVCRGNLAHKQYECLHLPKCLPGLPATTSQEIKMNIKSSYMYKMNFQLIELF
uniref:ZMYM2-like/QRICH1 C-terminal domain-containing protein n=1 Tax=Magallana gigas TaxID=29159 RepID=A0A8W8MMW5_MAGGI